MADYINKNILSQAYIHIESDLLDSEEKAIEYKKRLTEFATSRSSFFLSPDAPIEIELEDGSLKARVTVMGTLLLVLQGISNYKDFREGIQLLYSDAKRVTEYIISESLFMAGARQEKAIRIEARVGIIGSIQKIINQLDAINHGAKGASYAKNLSEKLVEVQAEIDKLLENIADEDDKSFVSDGLHDISEEIPNYPTPPKDKSNEPIYIASFQRQRKKLRLKLASAANKPL